MSQSTRIQVRFPGIVWDGIVAVAVAEGIPPTMWVVRACVDRLEGQDASIAPRNDESYRPTHDQHGWMKGPPRGR